MDSVADGEVVEVRAGTVDVQERIGDGDVDGGGEAGAGGEGGGAAVDVEASCSAEAGRDIERAIAGFVHGVRGQDDVLEVLRLIVPPPGELSVVE